MDTVLVANRGEIAVRIIRACHKMGIKTVAVCSEADSDSLHARLADNTVCIGKRNLDSSYLNIPALLAVARAYDAQYVHPGVGFLAESATFRRWCDNEGLTHIGPTADVMEAMGDKLLVKTSLKGLGVPMVPGTDEAISSLRKAKVEAKNIGYPVLLKAAAGGGGMGIRVVRTQEEFDEQFSLVQNEAQSAFGDGRIFIEKLLTNVRHVEVQVLADNFGNASHFSTRECSLQRRNQKLVEEAPASLILQKTRRAMQNTALDIVRATGYKNAGTVEFLVDKKGNYYFMEMNTRIQVEHPITEQITGVDLIQAQIMVAMNHKIVINQNDLKPKGHAIECRINAEDPLNGFAPSPGKVGCISLPGGMGVRVDSAYMAGDTVYPFYDSMMMKIIAHAEDRSTCIEVMHQALSELRIDGVKHNTDFHLAVLEHPDYLEGKFHTKWIEQKFLPHYLEANQ
ncbi:MAG: acetyl-CoA carboxylase biotin carboxylase subunit [Clostridiales bacterium]|nr:acetyl-CoA carboxylase biotin carboxylase subunit [Clostridiales bacterium]